MGSAAHHPRTRTRLQAATLAVLLLALPGLRSVQAGPQPCGKHRAPKLRCHENRGDERGHSTALRPCCRRGHGVSSALCGCAHRGDLASVASDRYVPVETASRRVPLGLAPFQGASPAGFARVADPPDPPPPIGSSPSLS